MCASHESPATSHLLLVGFVHQRSALEPPGPRTVSKASSLHPRLHAVAEDWPSPRPLAGGLSLDS